MRPGRRRRWRAGLLILSLLALGGGMILAVRRGAEARRVIAETEELRRRVDEARERMTRMMRRTDSLSSRARVLEVAGEMGFRTPADTEVRFLPRPPDPGIAAGADQPQEAP